MVYKSKQSGAVLYVAMIMLILMALIGIAAMRVATLQEKMSSDYRSSNLAFQNAEASARKAECSIENLVNRTSVPGCPTLSVTVEPCTVPFNPTDWSNAYQPSNGEQVHIRSIGSCINGYGSIAYRKPVNENANPVYEITAYNSDGVANSSADAAIDTILRP